MCGVVAQKVMQEDLQRIQSEYGNKGIGVVGYNTSTSVKRGVTTIKTTYNLSDGGERKTTNTVQADQW